MTIPSKAPRSAAIQAALALLGCTFLLGAAISRNAVYRDPVALWTEAVISSPEKARPHYNLGNAFRESGDLEQAIREWRQAVALAPKYSAAYNQLGNVSFLSGDLVEAERYYILSVGADPDNTEAHYNLALISEKLGKTGQAVDHYQQFLARGHAQPDDALRHAAARLQVLRER